MISLSSGLLCQPDPAADAAQEPFLNNASGYDQVLMLPAETKAHKICVVRAGRSDPFNYDFSLRPVR